MKQENTADNNNYITSATGNSEFCFPETLNVSLGGAEGNIEVKGKQTGATGNSEFCYPETLYVSQGGAEGNTEVKGKLTVSCGVSH